jgi:hypothetical protein
MLAHGYAPGLDEDERVAVDDGDDLGVLADQGGHSCTTAAGFLSGAIRQAFTGTVVTTYRNSQLLLYAVSYPA